MTDQIQKAIDEAKAKAEAASTTSTSTDVGNYDQGAVVQGQTRRMSVDDALDDNTGAVDAYLKVKTTGIALGDVKTDKIKVTLKVADQAVNKSLSYSLPDGSTVYEKSWDGRYSEDGVPWNAVITRAASASGKKVRDYTSYALVMTTLEDVGSVEEGSVIGYGTPYSSKRYIDSLIKEARAAGIDDNEPFEAIISYVTKESKQGSDYAFLTAEFVGPYEG